MSQIRLANALRRQQVDRLAAALGSGTGHRALRSLLGWFCGATTIFTVGCGASDGAGLEECPSVVVSALTNAMDSTTLPLSARAFAAIGALLDPPTHEVMCTGVYIGDRYVLTARHCDIPPNNGLAFRPSWESAPELLSAERFPHPELDVSLLRLPPDPALESLEPLRIWDGVELPVGAGETVTLAGLGVRADGSSGRLEFLDETVVSVNRETIVVDGGPEHGACRGDSGGPLLSAADDGTVRALGVLEAGSSSCRGLDRYVASTAFAEWVWSVRAGGAAEPCAGITSEGVCDSGTARYCVGTHVAVDRCEAAEICTWDPVAAGHRCRPSDEDPCARVASAGSCRGNVLESCHDGVTLHTDCATCGLTCALDASGHASCS